MTHDALILAAKNRARETLHPNEFAHRDSAASILAIISAKPELIAVAYGSNDVHLTPEELETVSLAWMFDLAIDYSNNPDAMVKFRELEVAVEDCRDGDRFLYDTVKSYIELQIRKLAA